MHIVSRHDVELSSRARRAGLVTVLPLLPGAVGDTRVDLVLLAPGARHMIMQGSATVLLSGVGHLAGERSQPGTVAIAGPGALPLQAVAVSELTLLVVAEGASDGLAGTAPPRVFPLEQVPDRVAHDPALGFYDMRARRLLDGDGDGCHFCLGVGAFAAKSGCHDLHRHPSAAEFFYVWTGSGVHLGPDGAPNPVSAGDLVHVPAGEWHGFRNTGDESARALFGYLGVQRFADAGYQVAPRTLLTTPVGS